MDQTDQMYEYLSNNNPLPPLISVSLFRPPPSVSPPVQPIYCSIYSVVSQLMQYLCLFVIGLPSDFGLDR
jgi:hypothetical protein